MQYLFDFLIIVNAIFKISFTILFSQTRNNEKFFLTISSKKKAIFNKKKVIFNKKKLYLLRKKLHLVKKTFFFSLQFVSIKSIASRIKKYIRLIRKNAIFY